MPSIALFGQVDNGYLRLLDTLFSIAEVELELQTELKGLRQQLRGNSD